MLICQPPIKEMTLSASCCRFRPHDTVEPKRSVINADGITVGDLLRATAAEEEHHRFCPWVGEGHHDPETGMVNFSISFEGTVQLRAGDPTLRTRKVYMPRDWQIRTFGWSNWKKHRPSRMDFD